MIQLLDLALFLGGNTFELLQSGAEALQQQAFQPIAVFALIFGLQLLLTEYAVEELGRCKHGTASLLEGICLLGFIVHSSDIPLLIKAGTSALLVGYLVIKRRLAPH